MSDRENKQPNTEDDLSEFRALVDDVQSGGDYTLDDILAEYGVRQSTEQFAVPTGPDLPWPEAKSTRSQGDNLIPFPSAPKPVETALPPEEPVEETEGPENAESTDEPEPESEDGLEEDAPKESTVIPFPHRRSTLSGLFQKLVHRGNAHADGMFVEAEQTDPEQVRRLEELIPGTDQESPPRHAPRHRERPAQPPPPDHPAQDLAKEYGRGLKGMRLRVVLLFLLCLPAIAQLVVPALGLAWPPPLDRYQVQVAVSAGLLAAGFLLSADALLKGVARAFRGRVGMDTLLFLAVCFTLADSLVLLSAQDREGQLPCCGVVLVGLFFQLHGYYHKRCGLRLSCRTAAISAHPYRVTLDEKIWSGRDTYAKHSGDPAGFGSQIQSDDGAQRLYRAVCPVLLLACVLLSVLASVAMGHPSQLLWCLSSTFTVSAAFGSALVYGRPFHMVARRLAPGGAALAGWPGVMNSRHGQRVLLTDLDLFPTGYVSFNGCKVLGNFSLEKVISYTATLIRDSGSGLTQLFYGQMRTEGGLYRKAERLSSHEGGGLSAVIRGQKVLVGSASFMQLMEIPLPPGLNIKSAVFCAIDGELAGIFVLNYTLPDTCFPALDMLIREKIGPVLATRDFNLIPATLRQRFNLAADRMDFPPVQRRWELSGKDQPHNTVLTALLCREGLLPFAESIVGARRLQSATRAGAVVTCAGSVIGLLLVYYLTSVQAFASLTPLNLLIYMLLWLLPIWFLTSGADRY